MTMRGSNGQLLISHRGNIDGAIPDQENDPGYIQETLHRGYSVEIDVWQTDDGMFLGHDEPVYGVDVQFFKQRGLWCHAKNFHAFSRLLSISAICFWHQEDNYTLTSNGWIWAYPGQPGNKRTVAVMPEWNDTDVWKFGAICSDVIEEYK